MELPAAPPRCCFLCMSSPYLVFDPTLSPHYEVFVIPRLRYKRVMRGFHDNNSEVMEKSEWPPSLLGLHVFSSKSGCWEGRGFIREGKVVGTVAEMRRPHWSWDKKWDGVYWRGDLFVLCEAEFIMRYVVTLEASYYFNVDFFMIQILSLIKFIVYVFITLFFVGYICQIVHIN